MQGDKSGWSKFQLKFLGFHGDFHALVPSLPFVHTPLQLSSLNAGQEHSLRPRSFWPHHQEASSLKKKKEEKMKKTEEKKCLRD